MDKVQALAIALPYLHEAMKGEATMVVVDRDEIVQAYLPSGKINVGYQAGQKMNADDQNLVLALRGQKPDVIVGKEVYGVEFNAYAFPIKEGTKVIGAVGFGVPIENKLKLEGYMQSMNGIINNLHDKVHTIASHSQQLAATTHEINIQAEQVREDAERSNGITDLIKNISNQTNLLGLNASIEAARAGVHGAGFNIVAQEVRKLSSQTSSATQNIEDALKNINSNLHTLRENLSQINQATSEQATLVQDFSTIIEQLNELSVEMRDFMGMTLR
ncbi:methyl-accepting chemotaxis protein [Lysinibacillus sp. KU-BSD001]|uniref:methyl-accepting chemotaxis protein n=1 Tax=Lysinibacillus sp. KU-BSD001 TaxID=3141328 RepID=UPI0036E04DF9